MLVSPGWPAEIVVLVDALLSPCRFPMFSGFSGNGVYRRLLGGNLVGHKSGGLYSTLRLKKATCCLAGRSNTPETDLGTPGSRMFGNWLVELNFNLIDEIGSPKSLKSSRNTAGSSGSVPVFSSNNWNSTMLPNLYFLNRIERA